MKRVIAKFAVIFLIFIFIVMLVGCWVNKAQAAPGMDMISDTDRKSVV